MIVARSIRGSHIAACRKLNLNRDARNVLGSFHSQILPSRSISSEAEENKTNATNWFALTSAVGLLFGTLYTRPSLLDSNNNDNYKFNSGTAPSTEGNSDTEKIVEEVQEGLRERLKALKVRNGLPPVTVVARGHQIVVRFPVPPSCDNYQLLVDAATHLGGSGGDMNIRAWNSAVSRQLIVSHPLPDVLSKDNRSSTDNLFVVFFEPLLGEKSSEIEFIKHSNFTAKELDAVVSAMNIAAGVIIKPQNKSSSNGLGKKAKGSVEKLEKLGVKVYGLSDEDEDQLSWDTIAGYQEQKREIEDSLLLALKRPEVYDSIARGTRHKYESNRPRAILFEGPPGTGKTSCARVIASQAGIPLLYVPSEVVMSKYYGESERLLSQVFNAGNDLPTGAIVFIDEIDSLAASRDSEMHEATRRMLSVLLRELDGFDQNKRIVVIAATNRKQDLDPALLSRFDASILFDLPDLQTREEITGRYARHLSSKDLARVAAASEGMSGRDIRDVCQHAERRWASKLIKGQAGNPATHELPPVEEYFECVQMRRKTHVRWTEEQVIARITRSPKTCIK